MKNILVTTLGTWGLIPEIYGFTNPKEYSLYKNSSKKDEIEELRKQNNITPIEEFWLIGTGGEFTKKNIEKIEKWREELDLPLTVRYFLAKKITDISSIAESNFMTDLIYKVVYNAKRSTVGKKMFLSLAGGRKTMSADIQEAAYLFGADSVIHVVSKSNISKNQKKNLREYNFLKPFSKVMAGNIMPLVSFSKIKENPIFSSKKICKRLEKFTFNNVSKINEIENNTNFLKLIKSEKEKSENFIFNFSEPMYGDSKSGNFTALYSLSPEKIKKMKNKKFGINSDAINEEYKFLKKLPKTELHCHMGGILNIEDLIRVAEKNSNKINEIENINLKNFFNQIQKNVTESDLKSLKKLVPNWKNLRTKFKNVPEPLTVAAFIYCFKKRPRLLEEFIFGKFLNEENYCEIGIRRYEALGDLQGSGILQNEESIRETIKILNEKTKKHNVKYLELRCSPAKYTRGGLTKEQVYHIIKNELEKNNHCQYGIIFIASRHGKEEEIIEHIKLTIKEIDKKSNVNIVGFDVAGDEKAKKPEELRKLLLPIMEKCLSLTIHAGETVDVESIWQAVYHLNAERIGHGLKLQQDKKLFSHFLDRKITVELCPSSNYQIIGYKDYVVNSNFEKEYPLKRYLKAGLKVCINTDNPGISRTDFTKELIKAAQLTEEGLSLWEILILIRNGFKASFLDYDKRRKILRNAENEIINILKDI